MARSEVREQMIRGAGELLATSGVQGTSFSAVLARTGAPRGSIYHHFPGGKEELVRAAVTSVGEGVVGLLDLLDGTPGEVIDAFVDGWRSVLLGGGYRSGCAVAATTLESAADPELLELTAQVFRSWGDALARALIRASLTEPDATDLAVMALAAVEGALVLGRAAQDTEAFEVTRRQLHRLLPA